MPHLLLHFRFPWLILLLLHTQASDGKEKQKKEETLLNGQFHFKKLPDVSLEILSTL